MQDIEHDMDDLFRRAAENYPLKAGNSNWESISTKINEHHNEAKAEKSIRTGLSRKYILLIFLFTGLVVGWFIFKNTGFEKRIFSSEKNDRVSIPVDINRPFSEDIKSKSNVTINNANRNKKQPHFIYKSGRTVSGFTNDISYFNVTPKHVPVEIINKNYKNSSDFDYWLKRQMLLSKIRNGKVEDILNNRRGSFQNIDDKKTLTDESINKKLNSIKEDEVKKNKKIDIINKHGGYIGLIAAIDFSYVNSLTDNSAGFGLGVLFGYQFNRKISLETGLVVNKKKYYSEGKYFNMDKIKSTMPVGMHIKSLFTNSSIIEIPIKIKYDFIANNKSNVYVSGGISAYIMTKEKNNYKATVNGSEEQFFGLYNKTDYRLPGVANISFGYEHVLSKFLNIRIEPFFKIPLKGIGVGNLPVTTAGLQLSVTRSLN